MAEEKKLGEETRKAVLDYLMSNARDTFLWVALVCQNLREVKPWHIMTKLRTFPPGLDAVYERMIQQIDETDDAASCKRILATVVVAYRLITIHEVTCLVSLPEGMAEKLEWVEDLISLCGSLLTVRDGTIYLVHQSATDYLLGKASAAVFQDGIEEAHYQLFSRSLYAIATGSHRDIYDIRDLGRSIIEIQAPSPDPLVALRYSIVYWVDHLEQWNFYCPSDRAKPLTGLIDTFLQKTYLYWLEALSLCRSIPQGIIAMRNLESLLKVGLPTEGNCVLR